ncbi:hypothetical protein NQ317_016336 [Molorchus minor]|uniref:Uncharacterized protein n=1 Tax=Molorchus minor TaxID=1323400 RepID=A0ABQ9J352_9CUCU|nr:hypothetical protein NQ317_016336 [Molorchus minor]
MRSSGFRQINARVGRMKDAGWSKELEGKQLEEELNEALSAAKAWMEIIPEKIEQRPSGSLQVGEIALLAVKSTLPDSNSGSDPCGDIIFSGESVELSFLLDL